VKHKKNIGGLTIGLEDLKKNLIWLNKEKADRASTFLPFFFFYSPPQTLVWRIQISLKGSLVGLCG